MATKEEIERGRANAAALRKEQEANDQALAAARTRLAAAREAQRIAAGKGDDLTASVREVSEATYAVQQRVDNGTAIAARARAGNAVGIGPDTARTVLGALDAEQAAIENPLVAAAYEQRVGPQVQAFDARLATPAGGAPPAAEVAAQHARDRETFEQLRETNPFAAAAFGERKPWVYEAEPGAVP